MLLSYSRRGPTRRQFLTTSTLGSVGLVQLIASTSATAAGETEALNVKITTEFCKAWERNDPELLASYLADDCMLRMSERSAVISGRTAALERFKESSRIAAPPRWEINVVQTFAKGPIVVNERHDRGILQNKITDYVVAGLFVIKDGKIKEWTDFMLPGSAPF
jgi:limonene-1,2-epoxide hydrolase